MNKKALLGISALLLSGLIALSFNSFSNAQTEKNKPVVEKSVKIKPLDACGCPPNWILEPEHAGIGKDWDKNDDGLICFKVIEGNGHGNDKEVWEGINHKDNLPCP